MKGISPLFIKIVEEHFNYNYFNFNYTFHMNFVEEFTNNLKDIYLYWEINNFTMEFTMLKDYNTSIYIFLIIIYYKI